MTRSEIFLSRLEAIGADAAILRTPESLLYLTGFTGGEGTAVITKNRLCLLVDSRYTLQAKAEACDFEILPHDTSLSTLLSAEKSIGIEKEALSIRAFDSISTALPKRTWVDVSAPLLMLRKSKDFGELSAITEAVKLADRAFSYVVRFIKAGMREYEVAAMIEGFMRREAGALPSFDTICASGRRSALPHGAASDKIIEKGDFLTMDFGCKLKGYCSDITRTVVVGKASDRQKEIYNVVLYAQTLAENAAKCGMDAKDIDAVARKSLDGFGYGEYFGHALGHGVGLAIHEYPTLSPRSAHKLEAGDVFTVEPGVYIPEFGGVRIEDMVYAAPKECVVLTKSPKALMEIL